MKYIEIKLIVNNRLIDSELHQVDYQGDVLVRVNQLISKHFNPQDRVDKKTIKIEIEYS